LLLRRYLIPLIVLAAASAGVGYWFWSTPIDTTKGRAIVAVAVSRSGRWFAAATASGLVGIWDDQHLDMPQHRALIARSGPRSS